MAALSRNEIPRRTNIRILIVDDHPAIREGLTAQTTRHADLSMCGEASELEPAWVLCASLKPDIVVVDISLKTGNGLDLVKRLKAHQDETRILVWSIYEEGLYGERALQAGAHGYINKVQPTMQVVAAIRLIHSGEIFASETLKHVIATRSRSKRRSGAKDFMIETFSDRELQVFQLMGEGWSTERISQHFDLSAKTVETYRARMKDKLCITSRTELVRMAVEWVVTNARHPAAPTSSKRPFEADHPPRRTEPDDGA